jgi:hypothetical protein
MRASIEPAAAVLRPDGWFRTGIEPFGHAAWIAGRCWVLRLNDFPEHPLYTLFVDGTVVGDLDDLAPAWSAEAMRGLPVLDAGRRAEVVELMRWLGPYGSEQGTPCDGDWCSCSILTEAWMRERAAREI